jgi:hypothetical protein
MKNMALSKRFKLIQHNGAINDLDDAIDYYNSKQMGLGKRFYLEYKETIESIKLNPYYCVFYDDVHCVQVGVFPYLIHYTVDTQKRMIAIEAIICSYKNPDTAYLKK